MASRKFEDITKGNDSIENSSVHFLPFKIEYEGGANVQTLFNETSQPDPDLEDQEVLINRFRGRPLTGKKIDIPSDYEGVVLTNLDQSSDAGVNTESSRVNIETNFGDEKHSTIRVIKKFSGMTYWNWDKTPSLMDAPVKLADWLQLSQALHEPIDK